MHAKIAAAVAGLALSSVSLAADLGIHVIVSGQVAPGVYGQVQIGPQQPPPPLVYARPMMIEPQASPPSAVYLHVPPGHARNWRKHCHAYNACNRPVYFIRSDEYSPDYKPHGHKHDDSWRHEDEDRGHGEHGHGHHDEE